MARFDVDEAACRGRQQRLLAEMGRLGVDVSILTSRESVQWLTGALVRVPFAPAAVLRSDGVVSLVLPERQLSEPAAAEERIGYAAKLHSTTVDDQPAASMEVLLRSLSPPAKHVGLEWSTATQYLTRPLEQAGTKLSDIGATMFALRRRKDPDELAKLLRANEANRAMYERARALVRHGVNELDVYSELHAAAVRTLGEPLTYFGQDFRSAARGGAPRDRKIEGGELYILDLGVGFRGYYSDNCRTLAVGEPTADQEQAWSMVRDVFPFVENFVRPGASCRTLFEKVQQQLDARPPWQFLTHLGHGVGLAPQEGPHLNPNWDDTFAEGDFIAVEPGLYHASLNFGVRLEQNYRVTATGVELLTPWPLELV